MATRTSRTAWNGTLQEGSGQVELTSSGVGTFDVSFPERTAEKADGTTSPEELIAAAHSSCYSMAAVRRDRRRRRNPDRARGHRRRHPARPTPPAACTSAGIHLTVRGEVEGLDADGFEAAAQAAKVGCPVSKALTGTTITLDASLA